jgi:uncharacterized membrane protein
MFLFFLLFVAAAIFLVKSQRFGGAPPWVRHHSPESEAKRILAERFARGDITSDDFLERASVLNWTPGSDTWEMHKKKRR